MADTKVSALTQNTAPLGGDLFYQVDDPSGTPTSKKMYLGDTMLAHGQVQGGLINGYISRTVASSNLTVAVKTLAGSDPSTNDPVYVRIGNTIRKLTAALSVTKNAGTNWFASGTSDLATYEVDYFVYMGYNATDGTVIGFARIPYGRVYSDFSTTSTASTYCAISTITTAASTDEYEVVGRFNATLSAGAGYTWSVPATSVVLSRPIFETRLLTFVPTLTGYSGSPTSTSRYRINGSMCRVDITNATGTSNATGWTATLPLSMSTVINYESTAGFVVDNSSTLTGACRIEVTTGAPSTISTYANMAAGNFTASGTKTVYLTAIYNLA